MSDQILGNLSPYSTREQLMQHFSMMLHSQSTGNNALIEYPYGSNFLTGLNPLWVFQVVKSRGPRCGPFMMYFDATNKCGDKCPMCFTAELRKASGLTLQIDIEKAFRFLDRVISLSPFLKSVVIGGPGEPLQYSHLPEILEFFFSKGLVTHIYSSGHGDSNACIEAILKYATLFRMSLDASSGETYKLTHGRNDFDRRCNTIRHLIQLREETASEVILGLHFVIQKHNFGEIFAFAELAKNLRVDYVEYVWESYYTVMGLTDDEASDACGLLGQARELGQDNFSVITPVQRPKHRLVQERMIKMTGAQVERHCSDLTGCLNFTVGGFVSLCAKERFNSKSLFNLGEVSEDVATRLNTGIRNGFADILPIEAFDVGCSSCFCNNYNRAMRTIVNFIQQNDDAEALLISESRDFCPIQPIALTVT